MLGQHSWSDDDSVTTGGSWGGGKTPSGNSGGFGDYKAILANLIASLKPGGDIEKSQIAEAMQEGKLLGAQLNASAISKGLGNVTNNTPVTVAKHVAKRKQDIRSGLLQQLLQATQFLANMGFQESETQKSREFQAAQSVVSQPQPQTSIGYGIGDMNLSQPSGFSAQAFPSLASAGGMSAGSAQYTSPIAEVFGGGSDSIPSFAGSRQFGDPYFIGGRDVTKPV